MRTTTAEPRQAVATRRPEQVATPARATPALMRLQRTHGNRQVRRMAAEARAGSSPSPGDGVLKVGAVGDRHEHEADAVAREVAGVPVPAGGPVPTPLAPALVGDDGGVIPAAAVRSARTGGRPLPAGLRERAEAVVGSGLGDVRIHTGRSVDALSDSLQARAFTVGRHVFVHRADYRPGTRGGDALLAHEVAHTTQPGAGAGRVVRRVKRSTVGKWAKAGATNLGIGLGKTLLGPVYDFFVQYLWLYKGSAQKDYKSRVELHPFKDLKKWRGDKKHGLSPDNAVKRYGSETVGTVMYALRALGSGLIKRIASYTSWAALILGLLGLIPGCHFLLPVAAAIGSVGVLLTLLKAGIDLVANTWTHILAWARYLSLPDFVNPTSPEVDKYLETYKEYRKTRGELVDDVFKVGAGSVLAGAGSAASGSTFEAGAVKNLSGYNWSAAHAGVAYASAEKGLDTLDVVKEGSKTAAGKVPDAAVKELTGNMGTWLGKGQLDPRSDGADKDGTRLRNVGTSTFTKDPNLQLLVSGNLIGAVNERRTRRGAKDYQGADGTTLIKRSALPGPPGHSAKGVLGLVVNPLAAIATFYLQAYKAGQKVGRKRVLKALQAQLEAQEQEQETAPESVESRHLGDPDGASQDAPDIDAPVADAPDIAPQPVTPPVTLPRAPGETQPIVPQPLPSGSRPKRRRRRRRPAPGETQPIVPQPLPEGVRPKRVRRRKSVVATILEKVDEVQEDVARATLTAGELGETFDTSSSILGAVAAASELALTEEK